MSVRLFNYNYIERYYLMIILLLLTPIIYTIKLNAWSISHFLITLRKNYDVMKILFLSCM